jgi:protein-tyrosine kinase
VVRNLKIAPTEPVDATLVDPSEEAGAEWATSSASGGVHRLGSILVELGRLDSRQLEHVLSQQSQTQPRRFGEVAVALGLVARADIDLALAHQFDVDFVPAVEDAAAELMPPGRVRDSQGEVLRSVRSQLMLRWFGNEPEQRTLAIVSHGDGEGRTHVCAHLATLLSQMDEDTLVIDADLRKPSMHTFFGVDNHTGLSTYLSQETTRAPIRAVRGNPRLHVLPAGPASLEAMSLLERRSFALLLGKLAQRYAFVLIDTPPAAQFSEAITAAVRASGCLLVTRRNRTRLADAQQLAEQLRRHSVEVLGAVINER